MQTHVFLIRALTNLHVGSGDASYGAVDKLVQRDPTTILPTIHSTSIKGALREHFEEVVGWGKSDPRIIHIFGSAVGDSDNAQQGNFHFFSADLLALAIPNEDENSTETFRRVSSDETIKQFLEKGEMLDGFIKKGGGKPVFEQAVGTGDLNYKIEKIAQKGLNESAEKLPVIARNQLENGISNNLWYEEIVPRETVFGWLVRSNGKFESDFVRELDGKIIQIGANATVGYGFCFFKKIN